MLKRVWTFKPHEFLNDAGNVKTWELRDNVGTRTFVDEVTRHVITGLIDEIPDQDYLIEQSGNPS